MRGKGIAMGHSQPGTSSGRKTLKRCKNKGEADNVVLIDVDSDSFNNVIIIDFPESIPMKLRGSSSSPSPSPSPLRKDRKSPLSTVICIDDDECTDNNHPGIGVKGDCNFYSGASSNMRYCLASNHSQNSEIAVGDECQFVQEKKCPFKLSKCKRTYSGKASTSKLYGLSSESESGSSDDDGPDCEFMEDSFGQLREQWEKASLKRRNDVCNLQSGMGDQASASRFCTDTHQDVRVENKTERHTEAPLSPSSSKFSCEKEDISPSIATGNGHLESTFCNPKQTPFADADLKSMHHTKFHHIEADLQAGGNSFTEVPSCSHAKGATHSDFFDGGSNFSNEKERSPRGPPLYPSHKQGTKQVNQVENFLQDKENIPQAEPSFSDSDPSGGIKFFHSKASLPVEGAFLCKGQHSVETLADRRFVSKHTDEKFQQTPSSCHSLFPNDSEHGTSFKENEKPVSRESSFQNTKPSDETRVDHVVAPPNEKVGAVPQKSFICRSPSLGNSEVSSEKGRDREKGEPVSKEPSFCNIRLNESQLKQGKSCLVEAKEVPYQSMSNSQQEDERDNLHADGNATLAVHNSIIDERENLKETDEYKRAMEEEWASRQRELKIQAEEAQELRRLRKRRKAERIRSLDMERRQKQRLEEMRETQKKDEENMSLKELVRAEVRKELGKLEITCHDMASLLRALGIHVSGALHPLSHEVRAAYKRALLSFHPDRAPGSDIRQQVEAEEKFKLISRMKEKFLPIS